MTNRVALFIEKNDIKEVSEKNLELINHSLENSKDLQRYIDSLLYNNHNNMDDEVKKNLITEYKKAILLQQKIKIIKNNLYFSSGFPEFEKVQFDFFKNEFEAFEKNLKLLSIPIELVVVHLMKELSFKEDSKEYLTFLEQKGYSSVYRIINELPLQSSYKINDIFKESSLLLELIQINKDYFENTSKNNLFETINYIMDKTEIINEPGVLTAMNVKNNPLTESDGLIDIVLEFMHIPEVRKLIKEYKDKAKEANNNFIYFVMSSDSFRKSLSEILKNNKEMVLKENVETILVSLFLDRSKRVSIHNKQKQQSIESKVKYFNECVNFLNKRNIVLSAHQKQSLTTFLIKDKKIEDIALPSGWFKEFGCKESFSSYLNKDFVSVKDGKIGFLRNDLYEENKEIFIKMVEDNPKIIEQSLISTFKNMISSDNIKNVDVREFTETMGKIFSSNELYKIYFEKNENALREPLMRKMKSLLKLLPVHNQKNEAILLNLSLFIENPTLMISNTTQVKKRI